MSIFSASLLNTNKQLTITRYSKPKTNKTKKLSEKDAIKKNHQQQKPLKNRMLLVEGRHSEDTKEPLEIKIIQQEG